MSRASVFFLCLLAGLLGSCTHYETYNECLSVDDKVKDSLSCPSRDDAAIQFKKKLNGRFHAVVSDGTYNELDGGASFTWRNPRCCYEVEENGD